MSDETAGQGQGAPANQSGNNSAQEPPEWYKNPPSWLTQPPAQQTQQPPANAGAQRGYGQDILTTLQALPEQLANAVKEMIPQQTTQQTQDSAQSGEGKQGDQGVKNDAQDGAQREPGKKSFSEWWFGR